MFDFLKIKQAVADLGTEIQKLRAEREALLQKHEDLEAAPACKADMLQLMDDWVERRGADFPQRLQAGVNYYFRHPLTALPENPKQAAHPMAVLNATADPSSAATLNTLEASLCYVIPDEIKRGLRKSAENWDYSDCGPPRVERVELIAAIDKRISEIGAQELELVEAAEASGLRL